MCKSAMKRSTARVTTFILVFNSLLLHSLNNVLLLATILSLSLYPLILSWGCHQCPDVIDLTH